MFLSLSMRFPLLQKGFSHLSLTKVCLGVYLFPFIVLSIISLIVSSPSYSVLFFLQLFLVIQGFPNFLFSAISYLFFCSTF